MHDKKKKLIRSILRHYINLLGLRDYRVSSRFKNIYEDEDLKDALAIITIDDGNKVIYIKMRLVDFNRMKIREIKRYLLHELLHSLFSELSDHFDTIIQKGPLTRRQFVAAKTKFDELEHKKINQLIPLILKFDKYKRELGQLKM